MINLITNGPIVSLATPEKYDLSDLTVIIPFRRDSNDRLNNLINVVRYFYGYFKNFKMIISENGQESHKEWFREVPNLEYYFEESDDWFHKTKIMNDAVKKCDTKVIALYDVDVLFFPQLFFKTVNYVKTHRRIDYAMPFNGVFAHIKDPYKSDFVKDFDFNKMQLIKSPKQVNEDFSYEIENGKIPLEVEHVKSPGACHIFKRDAFIKFGGCNENIKTYAFDDTELEHRFWRVGKKAVRMEGQAIHMWHHRGIESGNDHPLFMNNVNEYEKVGKMTRQELLEYIENVLSKQFSE